MEADVIRADDRSAPFFEAAAVDVLLIKHCASCEGWLGPEATGCPGCGGDPDWAPASGRGSLVSWAMLPGQAGELPSETGSSPGPRDTPGILALVELDEGPWLHTRLAQPSGAPPPRAGLRVTAHFIHPDEGASYPVFRPG
jgi:uncharacterized protein